MKNEIRFDRFFSRFLFRGRQNRLKKYLMYNFSNGVQTHYDWLTWKNSRERIFYSRFIENWFQMFRETWQALVIFFIENGCRVSKVLDSILSNGDCPNNSKFYLRETDVREFSRILLHRFVSRVFFLKWTIPELTMIVVREITFIFKVIFSRD